ncbi:hypothetical protein ColLi_10674 [Colletotrichum liriopes]|uniref:Uncharacterized protein n=1 Tax=Colletotrichum liriopes TaxID=708192 RepID=A0AA37LXL6_9PEZI|nr:hypothetical protein ColLi_10674 [Colletotrichum liriopes]
MFSREAEPLALVPSQPFLEILNPANEASEQLTADFGLGQTDVTEYTRFLPGSGNLHSRSRRLQYVHGASPEHLTFFRLHCSPIETMRCVSKSSAMGVGELDAICER